MAERRPCRVAVVYGTPAGTGGLGLQAATVLAGLARHGHEVHAALEGRHGVVVHVIGAPDLTALYARAISAHGGFPERHDGEAAARGLALIGAHAAWN